MDPASALPLRPRLFGTVVVPTDFSGAAGQALPLALGLAEHVGAELHLVHAPAPDAGEAEQQQVRERLAATCMMYRYTLPGREAVAMRPVVLPPRPAGEAVAAYARQQHAAFVVMASHGRVAPAAGRWWSEKAAYVVAHAAVPVLLVPPSAPLRPEQVVCTDARFRPWAAALAGGLGVPLLGDPAPRALWLAASLADTDALRGFAPAAVCIVPTPVGGDGMPAWAAPGVSSAFP